jgi:predicted N-formylglutamate amidohydrolase
VECPGVKVADDCICEARYEEGQEPYHATVQRVERTAKRREAAIEALLAPFNLEPVFQGDPRGYCVRILRPADRRGESYTDGIGVPA